MKNGESVGSSGGRVLALSDGSGGIVGSERGEGGIQSVLLLGFTEGTAEAWVAGVDIDIGELGGEFSGYCCGF